MLLVGPGDLLEFALYFAGELTDPGEAKSFSRFISALVVLALTPSREGWSFYQP